LLAISSHSSGAREPIRRATSPASRGRSRARCASRGRPRVGLRSADAVVGS